MAKEASSANPSVPLHEVLEVEFAVLHGKLPPDYPSSNDPNIRLTAIWSAVHELPEKQFFSESQFESYRMLGAHTMEKLCTDGGGDFRRFIGEILRTHLQTHPPDWLATLIQMSPSEHDNACAA
jgi:hypothetical protein